MVGSGAYRYRLSYYEPLFDASCCYLDEAGDDVQYGLSAAGMPTVLHLLNFYRSPRHHVEGGSLAVILVARSATRWLRLYDRR